MGFYLTEELFHMRRMIFPKMAIETSLLAYNIHVGILDLYRKGPPF